MEIQDSTGADIKDSVNVFSGVRVHSPKRAALYSAILPGSGQVYNGSYVKGAIFFAGVGYSVFSAIDNGKKAQDMLDRRSEFTEGTPSYNQAKSDFETYRNNRNISLWIIAGVYLVNIADAYTYAHLKDFPHDEADDGEKDKPSPKPGKRITFMAMPDKDGARLSLSFKF